MLTECSFKIRLVHYMINLVNVDSQGKCVLAITTFY